MHTVLIIEDDPAIRGLLQYVLDRDGYAVLDAASAEEAFERFDENDAELDLVIVDVSLGSSSGIRVAIDLRALLPNLRIIITSGFPESMWPEADLTEFYLLLSQSVTVLPKPFTPDVLLDTVHRLTGRPCKTAPVVRMKAAS
jgi:DNA-binding response OmpR family regulator